MRATNTFRAKHKTIKGEFAGPWQVLTWDFVNREIYVLPETDDHLEGGEQVCWPYNEVSIQQLFIRQNGNHYWNKVYL